MTDKQAIAAFHAKSPVSFRYRGEKLYFKKISALIYRLTDSGEVELTLELASNGRRSVTIAAPNDVKLCKEEI